MYSRARKSPARFVPMGPRRENLHLSLSRSLVHKERASSIPPTDPLFWNRPIKPTRDRSLAHPPGISFRRPSERNDGMSRGYRLASGTVIVSSRPCHVDVARRYMDIMHGYILGDLDGPWETTVNCGNFDLIQVTNYLLSNSNSPH